MLVTDKRLVAIPEFVRLVADVAEESCAGSRIGDHAGGGITTGDPNGSRRRAPPRSPIGPDSR